MGWQTNLFLGGPSWIFIWRDMPGIVMLILVNYWAWLKSLVPGLQFWHSPENLANYDEICRVSAIFFMFQFQYSSSSGQSRYNRFHHSQRVHIQTNIGGKVPWLYPWITTAVADDHISNFCCTNPAVLVLYKSSHIFVVNFPVRD